MEVSELREIYSQFKKDELLSVAAELGLKISQEIPIRAVTQAIIDDLTENGIPEDLGEVSDTLYQFLVVAEYIDDDGNILEEEEENEESDEVEEDVPDWLCFGYADSRDPACNKCTLYSRCTQVRISNRPECFGISYNQNEPECQMCIEAPFCKKEIKNG